MGGNHHWYKNVNIGGEIGLGIFMLTTLLWTSLKIIVMKFIKN